MAATRKTTARKTTADANATLTPSQAAVIRTSQRGDDDATKHAKMIRSKLRSNFADVQKMNPKMAKESANDNVPWPALSRDTYVKLGLIK